MNADKALPKMSPNAKRERRRNTLVFPLLTLQPPVIVSSVVHPNQKPETKSLRQQSAGATALQYGAEQGRAGHESEDKWTNNQQSDTDSYFLRNGLHDLRENCEMNSLLLLLFSFLCHQCPHLPGFGVGQVRCSKIQTCD